MSVKAPDPYYTAGWSEQKKHFTSAGDTDLTHLDAATEPSKEFVQDGEPAEKNTAPRKKRRTAKVQA